MMKDKIDECLLQLKQVLLNLKDIELDESELTHSKSYVEGSIKWLERLKERVINAEEE